MDFNNDTAIPATVIRGILEDDRMFGSVVLRATFELDGRGGTRLAEEQPWTTSAGPWEGPAGPMPGDELFYRGGVDLFVFGSARAAGGVPAPWVDVIVEIPGKFQHAVRVHGDRVWESRDGSLVPGAPAAFTELPLTMAFAYGGSDVWDELPIPFPDNPDGRGFYLEAAGALGRPLANIEDPYRPVTRWNDQPEPVGMGMPPGTFGPRLRRSVEFDRDTGMLQRLDPTFFNHAFPGMIAPTSVQPGDRVRLWGARAEGMIEFTVPASGVVVHVRIGEKEVRTAPAVDQIGIEPDLGRIFVTYRYPFRYRMIPLEKRTCTILAAAGGP